MNWNGEDSGFPNQAEIDQWQSNCCGIACARMIIDAFTGVFAYDGLKELSPGSEQGVRV